MKTYRIDYVRTNQTAFAERDTITIKADNPTKAAEWFTNISEKLKNCFILDIYEEVYAIGGIRWKNVTNCIKKEI